MNVADATARQARRLAPRHGGSSACEFGKRASAHQLVHVGTPVAQVPNASASLAPGSNPILPRSGASNPARLLYIVVSTPLTNPQRAFSRLGFHAFATVLRPSPAQRISSPSSTGHPLALVAADGADPRAPADHGRGVRMMQPGVRAMPAGRRAASSRSSREREPGRRRRARLPDRRRTQGRRRPAMRPAHPRYAGCRWGTAGQAGRNNLSRRSTS